MTFHKCLILIFVLTFLFIPAYGQNGAAAIKVFKLQRFSGDIGLDGYYNYKIWDRDGIEDNFHISYLSPSISLNTSSYILHPNLLTVNANAFYNPKLRKDIADIHPDRIERASRLGIDLSAKLLNKKKYRIHSNYKIADGYQNYEDISYINFLYKYWDVNFIGNDKRIPFMLTYSKTNSESENITSNRLHNFDTKRLTGTVSTKFNKKDSHRFQYRYTEDKRLYSKSQEINTNFHDINLNNSLFFDKKNNYSFNSVIREYIKYGNQESKEFLATERLLFKFPANFKLNLYYAHRNYLTEYYKFTQNNVRAQLEHQLFKSLRSSVFYTLRYTKHSLYNEQIEPVGFSFNYLKKIPGGDISINYYYSSEKMNQKNETGSIQIANEQHVISDGEILLLNYPFVNQASIVVKSMNQILIYQENLDYYLVDQGDYIEIQRIPGGQLANNSIILVDYTAEQANTYSYSLSRQEFSVKVSVLKQLVSVYYRYKEDAYSDVVFENKFSRDEYKQHDIGIKTRSEYHNAGIEYISKESTILPFELLRYFANMNLAIKKFQFFASASQNYYYKYGIYSNQSYFSSTANVNYIPSSNTIIQYSFNYRKQHGENIFLDIVKSKLEYSSRIRKLSYSFGLEYFHRNRLLEEEKRGGVFVQVGRRF